MSIGQPNLSSFEQFKSPFQYFKLAADVLEQVKEKSFLLELCKQAGYLTQYLEIHPGATTINLSYLAAQDAQKIGIPLFPANQLSLEGDVKIISAIKENKPKFLSHIVTDSEYPVTSYTHIIATKEVISNAFDDMFLKPNYDRIHLISFLDSDPNSDYSDRYSCIYSKKNGENDILFCQKSVQGSMELWINTAVLEDLKSNLESDDYKNSLNYSELTNVVTQIELYLSARFTDTEIGDKKYENLRLAIKTILNSSDKEQLQIINERIDTDHLSIYSPDEITLDDSETIGLWDSSGVKNTLSFDAYTRIYKDFNNAISAHKKSLTFHRFIEEKMYVFFSKFTPFSNDHQNIGLEKLRKVNDGIKSLLEEIFFKIETSEKGQQIYSKEVVNNKISYSSKANSTPNQVWFLKILNNIVGNAQDIVVAIENYLETLKQK